MTITSVGASIVGDSTQTVPQAPTSNTVDSPAKAPITVKAPEDKVELSDAAQAKLLEHQGQSVAQIASSLALTTKTVDDYLGLTETSDLQSLAALVQPSAH